MARRYVKATLLMMNGLTVGVLLIYATAVSTAGNTLAEGTVVPLSYLPAILNDEVKPTATAVPPSGPEWLQYVNRFREQANLLPLTENSDWSHGAWLHSRYMVKEDTIGHSEDPGSPWYTEAGNEAAQNGNVAVSGATSVSDEFAINLWMTGPFHAIGLLDPQLQQTGFGSYRENIGRWQMGATIDVGRGRGSVPPETTFPLSFPKAGGNTWLTAYGGSELPDPLASCPGYNAPSGPPIMIQLGDGSLTPDVTGSSFADSRGPLEYCIFDETNYSNSNSSHQSLGRDILNSRDAVVIMPRYELRGGEIYTIRVTANGNTTAWSFAVTAPLTGRYVATETIHSETR